jgi:long-chain acyl-CoA synthetase
MQANLQSVGDLLRSLASRQPDWVAMTCEGRQTTVGQLDRRSNQVAHGLIAALGQSQGRAAVLDSNSEVFFDLLFGAAKANRVLVPINYRLTSSEIIETLDHAATELLFVGSDFLPIAEIVHRSCRSVRQVITFGGHREGWESYPSWLDRHPRVDPNCPVGRSDVILLVYTSGTTGRPKGVQLTHENLLANAPLLVREYGSTPYEDVGLVCMPLCHVSGSLWALACLYAAAGLVILRRVAPADVLRAVATHRVSKALLVPAVLQLLLDLPDRDTFDVSSLDLILYGASPISVTLLRRSLATFGCHFGQVYGLTETAGAITYLAPDDHDVENPARLQSCGRPLSHVDIRVVGEDGRDVPDGQIGEIICRTAQNMKGYWRNAEETAAVLKGEWLHTGDAGYFDEKGYLYIHDRIKDMIISGGENVYPAEVERVLIDHPAVADAAVIGIPDDQWGEVAKAFVVKKADCVTTADALIEFCRNRAAAYKIPKSIEFVERLSRNAAGKLLKQELRAPYWAGRSRGVN